MFLLHMLNSDAITASLGDDEEKHQRLEKLEKMVSYIFAASFFLSAVLNYFLAVTIVTAAP